MAAAGARIAPNMGRRHAVVVVLPDAVSAECHFRDERGGLRARARDRRSKRPEVKLLALDVRLRWSATRIEQYFARVAYGCLDAGCQEYVAG
jgi:hypothetical protein